MSSHSHFDRAKYNQQECLMGRRAEREREAVEVEREELERRVAELEAEDAGSKSQSGKEREALKDELKAARYEVEHLEQALAEAVDANHAARDEFHLATQSFQAATSAGTHSRLSSSSPGAELQATVPQDDSITQKHQIRLRILGVVIAELTARRASLEADEGRYRAERARLETYKGFPSRDLQDKQKMLRLLIRRRMKMEAAADKARVDWPDGKEVEAARVAVAAEVAKVAELEDEVEELRLRVRRERGEVVVAQDELAEDEGFTDDKHSELAARLATEQAQRGRLDALLARLRRVEAGLAAASGQTQVELAEAGAAADAVEGECAAAETECGKLRERVKALPTDRRAPSPVASAAVAMAHVTVKQHQANINAATVCRAKLQSESAELALQVASGVDKELMAARVDVASLEAEVQRRSEAEAREVWGVIRSKMDGKLGEVGEEVVRVARGEAERCWAIVRGLENRVEAEREAAVKRAETKAARRAPTTSACSAARTTPVSSASAEDAAARSRAEAKRLGWAISQLQDMLDEAEKATGRQRGRYAGLLVLAVGAQLTV